MPLFPPSAPAGPPDARVQDPAALALAPLAQRLRPRNLDEYVGQKHLLGEGKLLRLLYQSGRVASLILWGPPGTGKTSLARLLTRNADATYVEFSAVLSGIKDVREVVESARATRKLAGRPTVLFVDEIHRFNKAQQDAFLPHVESGLITLIGATTENPSFEIIPALISRARVLVLEPLGRADLEGIIDLALSDSDRGLGRLGLTLEPRAREFLIMSSGGDARSLLNALELSAELAAGAAASAKATEAGVGETEAGREGGEDAEAPTDAGAGGGKAEAGREGGEDAGAPTAAGAGDGEAETGKPGGEDAGAAKAIGAGGGEAEAGKSGGEDAGAAKAIGAEDGETEAGKPGGVTGGEAGGTITESIVSEAVQRKAWRYDKGGEEHYNLISALHKSLRDSDPDGALYWLARMLEGGEDPVYLLRRMIRFASEDVGEADPESLILGVSALESYRLLGSPEGDLALAQLAVHLAMAPKSNSVYAAFGSARSDARARGPLEVPLHIRNAPTRLMKELGYGKGYVYAHDRPDAETDQEHLPDQLAGTLYYHPSSRGREKGMAVPLAARRARMARKRAESRTAKAAPARPGAGKPGSAGTGAGKAEAGTEMPGAGTSGSGNTSSARAGAGNAGSGKAGAVKAGHVGNAPETRGPARGKPTGGKTTGDSLMGADAGKDPGGPQPREPAGPLQDIRDDFLDDFPDQDDWPEGSEDI
ncbi:MAG: AAA family ATPase [Deltaproteobacteria bacterium]|jgi:putative ATPase|nr:AAA family ATPase [Deltaproteobacteria bacterium]